MLERTDNFNSRKATWLLIGAGAAMVVGQLVERGLQSGWRAVRDDDPPEKPWKRGQTWPTALAWAAISAGTVAAAQLAAKRGAHLGFQRLTGKRPPRSL